MQSMNKVNQTVSFGPNKCNTIINNISQSKTNNLVSFYQHHQQPIIINKTIGKPSQNYSNFNISNLNLNRLNLEQLIQLTTQQPTVSISASTVNYAGLNSMNNSVDISSSLKTLNVNRPSIINGTSIYANNSNIRQINNISNQANIISKIIHHTSKDKDSKESSCSSSNSSLNVTNLK